MFSADWPKIPEAAWSRQMDYEFPAAPRPTHANLHDGGIRQGLPIGGFGTGAIGRDLYGAFRRWTLKAGVVKSFCDAVNGFSVFQRADGGEPFACAMHPGPPPSREVDGDGSELALSSWNWSLQPDRASYHALFPKAWYRYAPTQAAPVELVCEQFSPVLPESYRECSLPVGIFRWHLHNPTDHRVTVSIMFSFMNMVGWFTDYERDRPFFNRRGGQFNEPFTLGSAAHQARIGGVRMGQRAPAGDVAEGDGEMCLAAGLNSGDELFTHSAFDASGDGREVWRPFAEDGRLDDGPAWVAGHGQELAGAMAVRLELPPGETRCVPMALSWDLPTIRFGGGRSFRRKYTEYFDATGRNATTIAAEAIEKHDDWSRGIDDWHRETTKRRERPAWFDRMLINECYLLVEGGTVWTAADSDDGPARTEHFGILECPDYPFYCTLDLWVYGSFVLLKHWPELEKRVVRDFAAAVNEDDSSLRTWLWNGELCRRKVPGALPHDLGAPNDDPFARSNTYQWQDSNIWKDLNPQFVLLVYRDFIFTGDDALVRDCYPAVRRAMHYANTFDRDGDGLIENDGVPDQTYDNIRFQGPSAYCNGLWLAALEATRRLADRCDDATTAGWAAERLRAARESFDQKLWTGTHYRSDTGGAFSDRVFIDQLFGLWFGRLCGIDGLVDDNHHAKALDTVYRKNYLPYRERLSGAVNFDRPLPDAIAARETEFNPTGCQVAEVLAGINLGFACQLDEAGFSDEALAVCRSIYDAVYQTHGLWFRTPAAWSEDGRFRAVMNLRPLVIWAMEFAPSTID